MKIQTVHFRQHLFRACIPIFSLLFSMSAVAAPTSTSPQPGNYCPGSDVLLVSAEELSATLEQVMQSRAALIDKDPETAVGELASSEATLRLAASRGAAARTILVIDAMLKARTGEDYVQLLTWFPLLQKSMSTLPDDATVKSANNLINQSKDIMMGDKDGDPMVPLRSARHMLACDGLDIPLHEAMRARSDLMKELNQNTKSSAYDPLRDALRSALVYTLTNGGK